MTLETLKRLRLIVPGGIILLLLIPLRGQILSFDSVASSLNWAFTGTTAIVLGTLYNIGRFRYLLLTRFQHRIDDNIRDQLLEPCLADSEIAAAAETLRSGRKLMNVFYWYVDNDESLKVRSRRVYFNGLIWTSAADLGVLSLFGAFFYWGAALLVDPRSIFIGSAGILAFLHLASDRVLLPRITAYHMELGSDQVGFIRQHYSADLCQRIRQTLSQP